MSASDLNQMDGAFQEKLANYEVPVPHGMFQQIQAARGTGAPFSPNRKWPLWTMAAIGMLLLALWMIFGSPGKNNNLNHFPIPLNGQIAGNHTPTIQESVPSKITEPILSNNISAIDLESGNSEDKQQNTSLKTLPTQQFTDTTIDKETAEQENNTGLISQDALNTNWVIAFSRHWSSKPNQIKAGLPIGAFPVKLPASISLPLSEVQRARSQELNIPEVLARKQSENSSAQFSLSAGSFVFKPNQQLEAFSESYQSFLNLRKETEQLDFGFGQQVMGQIKLTNGLVFKAGIAFSQVRGSFFYFNEAEKQFIINEVKGPDGNLLRADTSEFIGPFTASSTNQMSMIDIPVMVGFEKVWGDFGVGIYGGTYINVKFWQTGQTIDQETLKPVDLENTQQSGRLNKVGNNWYGSIQLRYPAQKPFNIYIEPNIRYYPNFFDDPTYVLKQKSMWAGGQIGILWNLDGKKRK